MSDFYPSITNYYDFGTKDGQINSTALPFSLLEIPLALTIMWIYGLFDYNSLKAAFASGDLYQQIVQCALILGGASFDATREKHCPYCQSGYNLSDYDWIIKSFRKK